MMQLSVEELRGNYEKEKAKLEEMKPKQPEPTPQGKRITVGQDTQIDTSIVCEKFQTSTLDFMLNRNFAERAGSTLDGSSKGCQKHRHGSS